MSTRRFHRGHELLFLPAVLTIAAWFTTDARGAVMDFRPSLSFGVFHDGNIAVVGGARGDEVAALAVDLVWDRKTPTSTFTLAYRPDAVFYREAEELNYFGNTFVVDFARALSETSHLKVDGYLERSEQQGQKEAIPNRPTTFVPRSTQTLAALTVDGSNPAGRRGFIDWQVRGGVERYADVPDDPATTTDETFDFNDSAYVGGYFGWQGELNARNSLGTGLGASCFGYENTANVVVATLGILGTSQTGPLWKLDYAFGASRATSDGASDDGFSFDVTIEYASGRSSSFRAGARQSFAPGTGIGGATQDLGAWLSYAHDQTSRGLFGSVLGGYWVRDSLEDLSVVTSGDTKTLNVQGSIGWEFNRFVALEAAYAFVDQNGTNGADPSLNTTYSSYGLYLRWAMRGR